MNKEDFLNTKWDARDWTEDMKRRWQEKMFELGFCWIGGSRGVMHTDCAFFFIYEDAEITHSSDLDHFRYHAHQECAYSFAFPETLTEQGQIAEATPTASDLLSQGAAILNQRGAEYEQEDSQERSFDSVAAAFNAITGKDLTAAEVALMLQCVKDVRQWSQDRLHEDSVIDGINYAALKGELLHKQYGESK